jgi:hypothetical protein
MDKPPSALDKALLKKEKGPFRNHSERPLFKTGTEPFRYGFGVAGVAGAGLGAGLGTGAAEEDFTG